MAVSVPANAVRDLFQTVVFHLDDAIHPEIRHALHRLLVEYGGVPCLEPLDLSRLTHYVAESLDFRLSRDISAHNHLVLDDGDDGKATHGNDKGKGKVKRRQAPVNDSIGDGTVKVVLPAWVTRSFDLQVVQQSRFYSPDPALFLSSTCICTSQLPIADDLAICAAVEAFGGQWRRELTREVTHLITVSEHGHKYDMAIKFGTELGIAIVLPHWFEESLKLNQLVPLDIYRFPSPPFSTALRDLSSSKPFLERLTDYWKQRSAAASSSAVETSFSAPKVTTATASILGLGQGMTSGWNDKLKKDEKYFRTNSLEGFPAPLQQSQSRPLLQSQTASLDGSNELFQPGPRDAGILSGKLVYLSSDLGWSPGLEIAIVEKIKAFGGRAWSFQLHQNGDHRAGEGPRKGRERDDSWAKRRIAEDQLRHADYVVMRHREGWEYWLSYDLDISIGTPPWLFYVFASKALTSPLSRLVHYPPPSRFGVPEFKGKIITVSNYTGLAREYVRSLIELLGATYQGTMARTTNFVVTASDIGSKCEHAKTWSIPLVTHLWLESCILSWSFLSPALSASYLVSSSSTEGGTLFPTILGSRAWTRDAIAKWNEMDARRDEREKGKKGVDELELEEDERLNDARTSQSIRRPPSPAPRPPAPVRVVLETLEPDQSETNGTKRPRSITNTTSAELSKTAGESDSPVKPKATVREPISAAQEEDVPAPPRARSKSAVAVEPVDVRKEPATTPTRQKPALENIENDSSALSDNDDPDGSSSSTSSGRASPPPSAKAISKHFNLIDPHNLVQPGSKRAAAGKARAALHVAMEDKNQFELEQKSSARKGGNVGAGTGVTKKRLSQGRESHSPTKRRKVKKEEETNTSETELQELQADQDQEDSKPVTKKGRTKATRDSTDDTTDSAPPVKRKKVANKALDKAVNADALTTQEGGAVSSFDNPPNAKPALPLGKPKKKLRILSTGLGLEKTSTEIKELKRFGITWSDKPHEVTHLVVKSLSRTEKFLCCLPFCPLIVTKDWIDASIEAGQLVDETPYLLRDEKKEEELEDTLEAILARAKKGKMLDGRKVYITKNVSPDVNVMQRIVSACGGIVSTNDLVKQHKKIKSDPDALVVSTPKDRREWDKLASEGVAIYTVEAVFVAAMHQSVERGFTNANRVDPQLSE
ncbi:uncharacterized protein JCM15063_001967 [Sporobolomyces koalae]|uniref:uncharacterized protein n=1 Tax=Sporobolomyces koalae TaxID=500713 RepID=UPI00317E928D